MKRSKGSFGKTLQKFYKTESLWQEVAGISGTIKSLKATTEYNKRSDFPSAVTTCLRCSL